jgi:large subunit ribosomal protein L15
MQKLPKLPGFRSHKTPPEVIYTGQLDQFANKTVDATSLAEAKLISNAYVKVKLIVKGDVTKKVTIKLSSASDSAAAAVEAAGGSFEKTARLKRPITNTDKKRKPAEPRPKAKAEK